MRKRGGRWSSILLQRHPTPPVLATRDSLTASTVYFHLFRGNCWFIYTQVFWRISASVVITPFPQHGSRS